MGIDLARSALAVGLIAYLSTTPAYAVAPPKAVEAYRKASKAYEMGRFPEALAGYEEAYRRDPRPETLFNLAQCQRQLKDPGKAAFLYRRYLVSSSTRPKNADLVEQLIREMDLAEAQQRVAAEKKVRSDSPAIPSAPVQNPLTPLAVGGSDPQTPPLVDSVVTTEDDTVFRKWWFWTAVGVVAVGAASATYVLTAPTPSATTLGTQDLSK
ncbi:MAG: tetratricopeptide repeat protein [Myxococcaceae bacterium]